MKYALLVDADAGRVDACLDAIRPFAIDVRIADGCAEAVQIVARHGLPALLTVDLSPNAGEAVAVIEAVCAGGDPDASVIAWCPSKAAREFIASRFHGAPVRAFGYPASTRVAGAAIDRALRVDSAAASQRVDEAIAQLLAGARRLCGAEGSAVVVKAPGDSRVRSRVVWLKDAHAPNVLDSLPHVFSVMLESGEPLFWSDHGAWALSGDVAPTVPGDLQALAAVPIVSGDGTIGVLCAFDVKPLALDSRKLEAFKALGQVAFDEPAASDAPVPIAGPRSLETSPGEHPGPVLLDRQSGDFAVARELARTRRSRQPLTVVLFAVDFVERHGGRPVTPLAAISDTLPTAIRGSDLAIRWSDTEFLLVLSGLTAAEARPIAERIRAVAHAAERYTLAVSGGIAELGAAESAASIVRRASERVQLARARGHNRVA